MQTFLPYPSFVDSARVLDYRRLGKQRVEAKQILNALTKRKSNIKAGWVNHPAVLMWEGYEFALCLYYNAMVNEWVRRGYNNKMGLISVNFHVTYPHWLYNPKLHLSHQSKLKQKNFDFYNKFFPDAPMDLDYWWPTKNKE